MALLVASWLVPASAGVLLCYSGCLLVLAVLWIACNPIARYKYRHIPGPFGWPFIGNLAPFMTIYQHTYFTQLHAKYGPVFKIWYGATPWVVVCEPDSIRKVAYKCNNRFDLPHALLGGHRYVMDHTLFTLRSETWRLMRQAWDPAMLHTSSLEGYAPLMHEAAQQLVEQLRGGVQPQEQAVDISSALAKVTLEVVGTCAFGIKFHGLETPKDSEDRGWGETGPRLLTALHKLFKSLELDKASKWVLPVLGLPPLADFFRCLAYAFPDEGHRNSTWSFGCMQETAVQIIEASRAQRQQQELAAQAGAPAGEGAGVLAGQAAVEEKRVRKGVLPGSFVSLLEAWKSKYEGEKEVSDDLLAAQVVMFLLAGYETTTNSLAFLLYYLSTHPEAQAKLQAEVDSKLVGRTPTLEDLPQLVYLDACIKETMRLRPAVVSLMRKNDLPDGGLDILGFPIPSGAKMAPFIFGVHRDPAYWERPEEYLPERFLAETGGKLGPFNENAYLPFGAGGRKCVGYKFAEREMMLVAACLVQNFTLTRPPGEGPLHASTGVTHAPIGGVNVLLGARK